MAERDGASREGYGDWRSLELAIKDAVKKAAGQAGPGVGAAGVDARIRQARFDRFLSRVFAEGERSEWLLKGGMSMLARVPRSRTTKDVDLAALRASDLAEAQRAVAALAEADRAPGSDRRQTRPQQDRAIRALRHSRRMGPHLPSDAKGVPAA